MQQIPADVLLHICLWLGVRDILVLRQLNRFFYAFTKTSNVWLSLLQRLTLLLPPGQPISTNASDCRTIEYFISRSMRFQQSWRWDYNPLPKHYTFDVHYPIGAMVFLPGGNHMVSVHDEGHDKHQTMIIIWDMSFRGKQGHVAIAMIRSRTSVERLQARYALVEGHISLVIAYVRPPDQGRTVIVAMYTHIALLNEVSRLGPGTAACEEFMKRSTDPFRSLMESSTLYPVGAISLSEINGLPILAVVLRPRTIVIYDLVSMARSTLKLKAPEGFPDWRHSAWCIKILPSQKQIFAVRVLIDTQVNASEHNPVVFELYDIPAVMVKNDDENGDDNAPSVNPIQRRVIMDCNIENCYISDGDASWNFRTHPDPDVSMLHALARAPYPPLSVFVVTKEKRGFIHFLLSPKRNAQRCHYDLPDIAHARYDWEEPQTPVIFPGGYHSIVIMRTALSQPLEGVSVLQLCTYRTESYEFSSLEDTGGSHLSKRQVDPGRTNTIHKPVDRTMKHPVLPNDLAQSMRKGTRCLQFDEWLGRLLITTTDNPRFIHVLDWSM